MIGPNQTMSTALSQRKIENVINRIVNMQHGGLQKRTFPTFIMAIQSKRFAS